MKDEKQRATGERQGAKNTSQNGIPRPGHPAPSSTPAPLTPKPQTLNPFSSFILHPSSFLTNEWFLLGLILFIGVCLRASYLHEIVHDPLFKVPLEDSQYLDYWARGLVSGDWTPPPKCNDPALQQNPFVVPPGYPYFLALVYWLSGSSYLAARLAQMGLGLVNCVLAFLLGKSLFGRGTGLWAALFMATYWAFIYFEGTLNSPVLVVFSFLCLGLTCLFWHNKPTTIRAFGIGLAVGLSALVRANAVLFVPVIVAWIAWRTLRRSAWRPFLIASAAVVIGTIAGVSPATIRNYRVSGEFIPIAVGGGFNLYMGHCEDADGLRTWSLDLALMGGDRNWNLFMIPKLKQEIGKQLGLERPMTWREENAYYTKRALEFVKTHPVRTLELIGRKAYFFWGPMETYTNAELAYEKLHSPALRYLPGFPAVMALFLLGLALLYVPKRTDKGLQPLTGIEGLILLLILVYYVSFLPFTVNTRYRTMVIPLMLMFAGYGLQQLFQMVRARIWRPTAAWAVAGLALYGVCSVQFVPYEPKAVTWYHERGAAYDRAGEFDRAIAEFRRALTRDESAFNHTALGQALAKSGNTDEAVEHYRKAIDIDPYYGLAHNNLGYELAKQGKTDEAMEHYRMAIDIAPRMSLPYNNLGNLLVDLGQYDEAIRQFQTVLELDPRDDNAQYNWGRALAKQGQFQEAVDHYGRALAINPKRVDVLNNLGLALAALGRSDDAIARYREALPLNPRDAKTHNNLGYELAKTGKSEAAAEQYEQAMALDPQFTLPLNNLGNLRLEQGKADEATALFQRAIQINPADEYAEYNLGNVLARQGKYDQAVVYFQKALKNNPKDPNIPNNLGLAYANLRRYQEAIDCYEKALKLDPRYVNALFNAGNVMATVGELDSAVAFFQRALEIDPNHALARQNLDKVLRVKNQAGGSTGK